MENMVALKALRGSHDSGSLAQERAVRVLRGEIAQSFDQFRMDADAARQGEEARHEELMASLANSSAGPSIEGRQRDGEVSFIDKTSWLDLYVAHVLLGFPICFLLCKSRLI